MLITVDFGAVNSGASVYYRILNADKTVSQARTNTGVTELISGSGIYGVEVTDSLLLGKTVLWDIDGTGKGASETFPNWPELTRTNLATELSYITSIKNKTDSLNFTISGKVDSNVLYVHDIEVVGTGTINDPWGPAP